MYAMTQEINPPMINQVSEKIPLGRAPGIRMKL